MIIVVLYLLGGLTYNFIWGFVCRQVVYNKGYDDNWFWWGFFFGIFAFLVAVTKPVYVKPQYTRQEPKPYNSLNLSSPPKASLVPQQSTVFIGWVCPKCGEKNIKADDTCKKCGHTDDSIKKICQAERERVKNNINYACANGEWICNKCQKVNTDHTYVCSCGMKKSENEKNAPVVEAKEETKEETTIDKIELLKKYKELLDSDIITKEEFEEKKQQLL